MQSRELMSRGEYTGKDGHDHPQQDHYAEDQDAQADGDEFFV